MDQMSPREKLKEELASTPLDELSYILGRYCGPHNVILAEKRYGDLASDLQRLVNEEISSRLISDILLSDE